MDVHRQCIGPGNFLEPGVSKNTIYHIYEPRNKQTKKRRILSIKYWWVHRNPYFVVSEIIRQYSCVGLHPLYTLKNYPFFSSLRI